MAGPLKKELFLQLPLLDVEQSSVLEESLKVVEKQEVQSRLSRLRFLQCCCCCCLLELHRISGLFYIRYPAGYQVSFAGYPAGRIAGKEKTVEE